MQSTTKNVKMGVCSAFFGGQDLGLTKGGVEVTVTTSSQKTTVDQFGETALSEIITGREVKAKVPLAETDIDRMVTIMPGATLQVVGGAKATGSVTLVSNPADTKTVVVNGFTLTFKTVVAAYGDVKIGADVTASAAALRDAINSITDPKLGNLVATSAAGVVTVTHKDYGVAGNAVTLTNGNSGAAVTVSGATLAGGSEPTAKRVVVPHGVSTDLRTLAKELRLRPQGNTDGKEDFTIPLAMTPGALTFAYQLDQQRVYNVEFTGYPDDTGKLFMLGDPTFI